MGGCLMTGRHFRFAKMLVLHDEPLRRRRIIMGESLCNMSNACVAGVRCDSHYRQTTLQFFLS